MGQIVFNGQKPKYCNLQAIQEGGLHYTDNVALNEIWLVDTTNLTKINGIGEYDAYIIGNGQDKAGQLELHYLGTAIDISKYSTTVQMQSAIEQSIANANIPRNLSQLNSDTNHQTVSQTEKDLWNAGGAGEIVNNVDNEDLTSVEIAEGVNVIKFKDKEYNSSNYSGYGKTYLRKNYITEAEKQIIDITPSINSEEEDPSEDPSETPEKVLKKCMDLSAGVGGTAKEEVWTTLAYLKKEVVNGDNFVFQASVKGSIVKNGVRIFKYFWGIIDKETSEIYQVSEELSSVDDIASKLDEVTIQLPENVDSAYLIINVVIYNSATFYVKKAKALSTIKEFNIIPSVNENNTVFTVSYDYDLNGRVLKLPENSVLKFEGGSIKDAFIIGNNTIVEAGPDDNIFGRDTEIIGSWKTKTWYAKWFGVYADGEHDDTKVLQKMLNLSETTSMTDVVLNWYGCTFRTTKGLLLKDYTAIRGGTILAKFDNLLDWVLQSYCTYGGRKVVRYNGVLGFDEGRATVYTRQVGIKDLTIKGELNDNGDGTWSPIFGGLRLLSTSLHTENVSIDNVGYGMCRSNTITARDVSLYSHGCFCAYIAWCVINLQVDTAYFQAYSHHTVTGPDDKLKHIPFKQEYHPVDGEGKLFAAFNDTFIDGNGGIDDTNPELRRPRLTALKAATTTAVFNNVAMDYWQEVAYAVGDNSSIIFNMTRFESVGECYLYLGGRNIFVTLDSVITSLSDPEYDIYQRKILDNAVVNLISARALSCTNTGNNNATTHKLGYDNAQTLAINVIDEESSAYPDMDVFHFLGNNRANIKLIPEGHENSIDSHNGQWALPAKCNTTNRNIIIPANTTSSFSQIRFSAKENAIKISGENRNTSVLKIVGNIQLGGSNSYPVSFEFRNMTIDCSQGALYMNIAQTVYGDGGSLKFINCNIINATSGGFIRGASSIAILYNIELRNCTIYSKSENIFSSGVVKLDGQDYNAVVASPVSRFGSSTDANVKNLQIDFVKKGTAANRNSITYHLGKGCEFYNLTTGRHEIWNGRQWVLDNGYPYVESKGVTANTPALPLMKIGTEYEDTESGVKKILTSNGTCGYGTFAFNAVFPISTKTFYVGTTAVTPDSNGAFSVNLPAGTYPVYCVEGNKKYECQPSTITISGSTTFPIYIKESKYSTKFEIKIDAVDGNGEFIQGLTVRVGPYVATENATGKYYSVSIPNGQYMITADGYSDQIPLYVNGLADRVTATFETEAPSNPTTVVLDGYLYDHDHICDNNGTNVVAGKYNVSVDSTSLEVSVTATDLSTILYFIDDAISNVNKQLGCLLMKKWFEAGHYGELSGNNVKLYSDTVGSTTGNAATFTDTSTNLVCTVTHTAGTNAAWENASSGGSDSSMNIVAASGTSLTANINTYYTFAAAVNTLAVTLPAMTDVTSVKALCLAFTAGTTPQITFTSADSKTVAYYDTYGIDAECEYEVTCLFNGTKWIIASALIR